MAFREFRASADSAIFRGSLNLFWGAGSARSGLVGFWVSGCRVQGFEFRVIMSFKPEASIQTWNYMNLEIGIMHYSPHQGR